MTRIEHDPETALAVIATGNTVIEDLPVLIGLQDLITEALCSVSCSFISFVTSFQPCL